MNIENFTKRGNPFIQLLALGRHWLRRGLARIGVRPPPVPGRHRRHGNEHRVHSRGVWLAGGVIALLGISALSCGWKLRQPGIVRFTVTVTPPGATTLMKDAIVQPVHFTFSGSAARLQQIGKTVTAGITLDPRLEGEWKWLNDRELVFKPANDWPAGEKYRVRFERTLFPDHFVLQSYTHDFQSAPFTATLSSAEFYQDPADPRIKRVEATVGFSHAVNPAEFEQSVRLNLLDEKKSILNFTFSPAPFPFTVTWDEFHGVAYIHSALIPVPDDDRSLRITLSAGLHAAAGGPGLKDDLVRPVRVPGMYTYFHVNAAELAYVRNDNYEPEQVLVISASNGVLESEMAKAVEVVMLPKDRPAQGEDKAAPDFDWHRAEAFTEADLCQATPVKLTPIPADKQYATQHSFKYFAPPGRFFTLRIKAGTPSYGGYKLAADYSALLQVPALVKELSIMYDGAILSMSGERKLSVLSRDLDSVRFEIARVLPGQITHLVSQSAGDFKNPYFQNYEFGPENIAERFSVVRDLARAGQGKTQYTAFDFSKYLSRGQGKLGLFLFRVRSWDRKLNAERRKKASESVNPDDQSSDGSGQDVEDESGIYGANDASRRTESGDEEYNDYSDAGQGHYLMDHRLILVTDLGMLVKRNNDGSSDLFIQNIHDGNPAAGVQVEILGKNGLPVLSALTGADGHAAFPTLKDFRNEKAPTVYIARRGEDLSFLPYNRSDRQLDFSRFDTGGLEGSGRDQIGVYLFSDRGIYRPGDEIRAGLIARSADWRKSLTGVSLEIAVIDARGLEIHKEKITLGKYGFAELHVPTTETSPTGVYQIEAHIVMDGNRGGLLGSTTVRVEEFLPDRMKISARFSAEQEEGWIPPEAMSAKVLLTNLTGIPAENHKVSASLTVSPAWPAFSSYHDYSFRTPRNELKAFTEQLNEAQTDAKGEVEFPLVLKDYDNALYRLTFACEGFEAAGGRAVTANKSILVSALPHLVGWKADGQLGYIKKGSARSVDLVAVNPELKRLTLKELTTAWIEIRHVSVLVKQSNGTYKYESVLKEIIREEKPLTVLSRGTKLALGTAEPGDYKLVIKDKSGDELNTIAYSVAGEANLTRSLDKNAELQIKLNKTDYAPGEPIEIQIKAAYTGTGLITIERDRVNAFHWFRSASTNSIQTITLPAGIEGNGYVNVAFVRAMDSPEIYMSPLSYGVAPFSVSRAQRTMKIELTVPDTSRPGEPLQIRYRSDVPGKIVVFAVDEGILQVAGYRAPDPLGYFFQKRALQVQTAQILDLILPEFKLLKRRAAAGGDEGMDAIGKNLNPFKRKRDKPAVYWSGILTVDQTRRTLNWVVPDTFNGSVKIFAVALTQQSIGVLQRSALVRGDFIISANLPTFAAPGDEFEVGVTVANNVKKSGAAAPVKLELATSEHVEVLDGAARSMTIPEGHEISTSFRVRAKEVLGSGNFSFTATLAGSPAPHHGKVSVDLSVRPASSYLTTLTSGYLRDPQIDIPVPRARVTYPQYRALQVSASPLPFNLAHGLIQYLEKYPHGCTEQLTSQAFPALVLRGRPEFGYDQKEVENTLKEIIRMLRSRQKADGSIGMWSANSYVNETAAIYALHFLTEAKERGFPVPPDLLQRGLEHLKSFTAGSNGDLGQARQRAYALYLLTRNGIVMTNEIISLRTELDGKYAAYYKKDLTAVYLAAVYQQLKQMDEAEKLLIGLRLGDPQIHDYNYLYDGLVRDAQYLYIISRHFPDRLKKFTEYDLLHFVNPILGSQYNTISSAYTILALDAYARAYTQGADMNDVVQISEIRAEGPPVPLALPKGIVPQAAFSGAAVRIRIAAKNKLHLFYQVTEGGFDIHPPEKEIKQKLEVQREYRNEKGETIVKAALGEVITARIRIRSLDKNGAPNIAVVDLLPAGFEVVLDSVGRGTSADGTNGQGGTPQEYFVRSQAHGGVGTSFTTEYLDIREDRVVIYGGAWTTVQDFTYQIRATNKGTYRVPPVQGDSMYDRTIQARSPSSRMIVE